MGLYATSFEEGDALSGNLFGVPHYQAIFLGTIDLPAAPAQDHGEPLYVGNFNALYAGLSLPTTNVMSPETRDSGAGVISRHMYEEFVTPWT
jgi:hypothetical protein